MVVKIVRELGVLLRGGWTPLYLGGPHYYGNGLGALAVCSKGWWDVVVEVMYKVDASRKWGFAGSRPSISRLQEAGPRKCPYNRLK